MALAKFMKRSSESVGPEASIAELELPDEPNFRPLPRRVSLEEMLHRNEDLRKMFPNAAPTEEQRLAMKVHEEFIL